MPQPRTTLTTGELRWLARFDSVGGGPLRHRGEPHGSRLFVNGTSQGGLKAATIAYDAVTGNQLWLVQQASGLAHATGDVGQPGRRDPYVAGTDLPDMVSCFVAGGYLGPPPTAPPRERRSGPRHTRPAGPRAAPRRTSSRVRTGPGSSSPATTPATTAVPRVRDGGVRRRLGDPGVGRAGHRHPGAGWRTRTSRSASTRTARSCRVGGPLHGESRRRVRHLHRRHAGVQHLERCADLGLELRRGRPVLRQRPRGQPRRFQRLHHRPGDPALLRPGTDGAQNNAPVVAYDLDTGAERWATVYPEQLRRGPR